MGMNTNLDHSDEPQVLVDMNTTPLIDVMLVLLIMLIITIPAQLHSVNLDMPQPSQALSQRDPVVVRVDVDAQSRVSWNGKLMGSRAELDQMVKEAAAMSPQPEVHIRSHAKAKYDAVVGVLVSAQSHGLTRLGIVGSEQFAN